MLYALFLFVSQGNGIHRSFSCSATSGSGDRLREEGCYGGGVCLFFAASEIFRGFLGIPVPQLTWTGPITKTVRHTKDFRAKIQPKVFLTEVFGNPLGLWTSAPSGHGCPRQNACCSRIQTALTEVLGRDIRANDPRMSAGCPSQKLPLWADFSFLKDRNIFQDLTPGLKFSSEIGNFKRATHQGPIFVRKSEGRD